MIKFKESLTEVFKLEFQKIPKLKFPNKELRQGRQTGASGLEVQVCLLSKSRSEVSLHFRFISFYNRLDKISHLPSQAGGEYSGSDLISMGQSPSQSPSE